MDSLLGAADQEREIIRHGYADEALGVLNDAVNSFNIRGPVFGAEYVWRALKPKNSRVSLNSVTLEAPSIYR